MNDFIEVDGQQYVSMERYRELSAYCQQLQFENQRLQQRIDTINETMHIVVDKLDEMQSDADKIYQNYDRAIQQVQDQAMQRVEVFLEEREILENKEEIFRLVRSVHVGNSSGFVYVIRDIDVTGYYKIGLSRNPKRRFNLFAVNLPFRCDLIHLMQVKNVYSMESKLHTMFADKRVNGEWFNLDKKDIRRIKSLKDE